MQLQAFRRDKPLAGDAKPIRRMTVKFRDFNESAAFLRKMADSYAKNRAVRGLALDIITRHCESRDKKCQALAIAEWVQQNIYYVHEGFETYQTPTTTIAAKAGDCDDFTVLQCAMMTAIGIKNAMAIMKINRRWAHIFAVALIPTSDGIHRMTLDATMRESVRDLINPIAKVRASGRTVDRVKFV